MHSEWQRELCPLNILWNWFYAMNMIAIIFVCVRYRTDSALSYCYCLP